MAVVAQDDGFFVYARENAPTTFSTSVLANDQGGPFTLTDLTVTSDKGASVTLNPDGTFIYDPTNSAQIQALSANSFDSFTYSITDGTTTDSASVAFLLANEADFAVAVADSFNASGSTDTPSIGIVLSNDSVTAGETATVVQVNDSAANVGASFNFGQGGILTVTSNGNVEFQATTQSRALPEGQNVVNQLTYRDGPGVTTVAAAETSITVASSETLPVSSSDLLQGLIGIIEAGGLDTSEGTSATTAVLTNGQSGNFGDDVAQSAAITSNTTLTYTLDTSASPFGYDIRGTSVTSGWRDAGRDDQNYSLLVETFDYPGVFTPIASLDEGLGGTDPTSAQSWISTDGFSNPAFATDSLIASGVTRVRFEFGPQENGYVGYREIDVFGSPTPKATLSVTVAGVNDAPALTISNTSLPPIDEGQTTPSTSGTFSDVDLGDTITITATVGGNPVGVVTQDSGNSGNWSWNAGNNDNTAGPVTVTITATDTLGLTATTQFTYQVNNVAPTLTISGAATSDEGSLYTLTLASNDPGDDTLTSWTINWGDGSLPETVPGNTTTVTHVFGNGPLSPQITATAFDEDNAGGTAYTSNTLTVNVANVAPDPYEVALLLDGDAQDTSSGFVTVTPGMTVSFEVAATDVATDSVDGPFTFEIDFGDGAFDTGSATLENESVVFRHVYLTTSGSAGFQPQIRVTDSDGGVSAWEPLTLVVSSTLVVIDDVLYVGGTELDDRILVSAGRGGLIVRMNNRLYRPQDASSVVVYGSVGSDIITYNGSIPVPVTFYGGEGNDYLSGSRLADTLDGGAGRDRLFGGGGDDTLLGGDGNDSLNGGNGSDYIAGDEEIDILGGTELEDGSFSAPGDIIPSAEPGNDSLSGYNGNDLLFGNAGNDFISGGAGSDILRGGEGSDRMQGGSGNDVLTGDDGSDLLQSGAGRDVLIGGMGLDIHYGGSSADLIFAGTFEEGSLDLAQLILDWGSSATAEDALAALQGVAEDDNGTPDSLNGEGDGDWYLTFMRDFFQVSAERRDPNQIFPLDI